MYDHKTLTYEHMNFRGKTKKKKKDWQEALLSYQSCLSLSKRNSEWKTSNKVL